MVGVDVKSVNDWSEAAGYFFKIVSNYCGVSIHSVPQSTRVSKIEVDSTFMILKA